MKWARLMLLTAALAFVVTIAGCQKNQVVGNASLKSYGTNCQIYDYVGNQSPSQCR